MYDVEWLIGIGTGALVLGLLIGLGLGRTLIRSKKTKVLEEELEKAEGALRDYRAEVYDQFAETARKFETLNESYHDLHRHLASSANTLLGDGISTPLLRGPAENVVQSAQDSPSAAEQAPAEPSDAEASSAEQAEAEKPEAEQPEAEQPKAEPS